MHRVVRSRAHAHWALGGVHSQRGYRQDQKLPRTRPWPKISSLKIREISPPPFEISSLVLDLDSEGNPHVRPWDSGLDGLPESPAATAERKFEPTKERVQQFEQQSSACKQSFEAVKSNPPNPMQISHLDIMNVCLLNTTQSSVGSTPVHQEISMISDVLDQNGIPPYPRSSVSKTIAYMRRRQVIAHKRASNRSRLRPEAFSSALLACKNVSEISRVVRATLGVHKWRTVASEQSSEIARQCQNLLSSPVGGSNESPRAVLEFLNDFTISLRDRDLPVSMEIGKLGLALSVECGAFAAAQGHIKVCLDANDHSSWDVDLPDLLGRLLKDINRIGEQTTAVTSHMDMAQLALAYYILLTGNIPGEVTKVPSIRDLIAMTTKLRAGSTEREGILYMHCLSRLGAYRTILHETRHPGFETVRLPGLEALLSQPLGGVTHKILQLPGFLNASERYEEDVQLDLRDYMLLENETATATRATAWSGDAYVKHDRLILDPSHIGRSLQAIQDFWLPRLGYSPVAAPGEGVGLNTQENRDAIE